VGRIEKTVFVSYRHHDESWALAVFADLTHHGYDVFIDYNSIASGSFETAILENIKARAHFIVLLTPTALDRCTDPNDWMRREIEVALDSGRNIVPLMLVGFNFSEPTVESQLTGKLGALRQYNGLGIPRGYFSQAMESLRNKFLKVPVDAVLHPASDSAQQVAKEQRNKANVALEEEQGKRPQPQLRTIEDFMQKMIHTTWIKSDKEHIEIADLTEKPKALAKLDHLTAFSMVSTVTRIVNEQPLELIFHLLIAPFQQSELPFTYRQILGLGRLSAEDQSAIHQLVLDAQETDNGITDFFEISKLRISAPDQEGRNQVGRVMPPTHYRLDESRRLVYKCYWERSPGPYKIEFEVKSIVFEQHAWYTYRTLWCISDQLSVSLKSPNKLDCFCNVWPIKEARPTQGQIGRKYVCAVDLQGPIFAGSEVRWIFHAS
jgi:TIR domain